MKNILELEYFEHYKKQHPPFYIGLTEMSNLKKSIVYKDNYPFLAIRKSIMYICALISSTCYKIIKLKAFDNLVLAVIITNTVSQAINTG